MTTFLLSFVVAANVSDAFVNVVAVGSLTSARKVVPSAIAKSSEVTSYVAASLRSSSVS